MTIRTHVESPRADTQEYLATAESQLVDYEVPFGEFWYVCVEQRPRLDLPFTHTIQIEVAEHLLGIKNRKIEYIDKQLGQNPFLQLRFSEPVNPEICKIYLSHVGHTSTSPREARVKQDLHKRNSITLSGLTGDRLSLIPLEESGKVTFEVMSGSCAGEIVTVQWDQETKLPQVSVQSPGSP